MHGSDWNPSGGILHIVPNELNQVVDGYTPLASRLGVLARDGNLMPLTYRTWSHVPKENKERIWREVKVKELFHFTYQLFLSSYMFVCISYSSAVLTNS